MCIAIPARIVSIEGQSARVETGSLQTQVLLAYPDAKVNDWVLIQSGIALATIEEEAARETLELLKMARHGT